MENDIIKVIQAIKDTDNPKIKAYKLTSYLSDLLKKQKITIYEAYLLNGEILNYMREWYRLPAWNGWVQISTCLEIFNQRLLAVAFKEMEYADLLKKWGREALQLCTEKRQHYIIDRFAEFMDIDENSDALLQELLDIRKKYMSLSDNKGPYHIEAFPYHYFEPEKVLLEKKDMTGEKSISTDIETLLVELNI